MGGSLKDAVSVLLKNVGDWQLAVALARVVDGDDGPILRDILTGTVIPLAFKDGNRWLASWAFWLLRRRDIAVRILVVCVASLCVRTLVLIVDCVDTFDGISLVARYRREGYRRSAL